MSEMEKVFELFRVSFDGKGKCSDCRKRCSTFCPDKCLQYDNNRIPDYSCNFLRAAYVLRYFPTHKAELKKLFEVSTNQIFQHLSLQDRNTKIVFLGMGAGPGTDLIAFCEWLCQNHEKIDRSLPITFIRADSTDDWINQYEKLREIYNEIIAKSNAEFTFKKRIMDAFDVSKWPNTNLHITSASYLISELIALKGFDSGVKHIKEFWEVFKEKTTTKSIILINDRPEEKVIT